MLHGLIYSDCGWCYICNFDEICLCFGFFSPRVSLAVLVPFSVFCIGSWVLLPCLCLTSWASLSLSSLGCYVVIQDGNMAEFSRWSLPLPPEGGEDFQVCSCCVACAVRFCDKAEDLVLLINQRSLIKYHFTVSWYCLWLGQKLWKHPLPMAGGWN